MIIIHSPKNVYLFITDDQTALAQKVLEKDPFWIVPPLWQSEFRNVLASYIRRGMPLRHAKQIMNHAMQTMENRQVAASDDKIFDLIAGSHCTAYNCEFAALARQLNIFLVTADKQLLKEFPDCAVSLEEFVK
jgi:predicted nucleic acid-binding protein